MATESSSSSKVVCELGDATVTTSEVAILQSRTAWLNDNLITFYFEYLEESVVNRSDRNVTLIHPTAAFMLRLLPPEDLLVSTGGKRTNPFVEASEPYIRKVIIPINNSSDPELAGGGSHWSLLVVDKALGVARHLDSSIGINRRVALDTTACISRILHFGKLSFEEPKVYQQINGYDCGVFLLLHVNSEILDQSLPINSEAAARFRHQLLQIILDEAQKRLS